jgi:hypothetical protein
MIPGRSGLRLGPTCGVLSLQPIFDAGTDESFGEGFYLVPDNRVFLAFPGKRLFQFHVTLRIEKGRCAVSQNAGPRSLELEIDSNPFGGR